MKKIYMILAVFALLSLSLNAQTTLSKYGSMKAPSRAASTVTVGTGSTTSQYLPVYGYWYDDDQKNQMIYTATQLGLQAGDEITSITFYSPNIYFSGGSVTLSLGTTTNNAFSSTSFITPSDLTQVAQVVPTASTTDWTITFSQPFRYTSGNLLVQIVTSAGSYGGYGNYTYFNGDTQSGNVGLYSHGSYNPVQATFLPKATFTYESASTDPSISASPSSVNLSSKPGQTTTETVNVTGMNLTTDITASISGTNASVFSVTPSSLGSSGGSLTVTYSPTAVGTHSATLTLSSAGAPDVTITLNGTCANEETVCEGSITNGYLPVYGNYFERNQINQMIYPASMLTAMNGKKITSMKFYPQTTGSYTGIRFYNGSVTFSLGNLAGNTSEYASSPVRQTGYIQVASISMPSERQESLTEWEIVLDTPFEYNGGDLLIDVTTVAGDYGSTYFYGVEPGTYQSYYYREGGTATRQNFLPKVTFTLEDSQPRHDLGITLSEPTAVTAGENATITATVTNNGNQTESGYTVTFSDGTNTFSTQTGGTLAPGATETFTATYPTTAAGTVTITANVACTDDANTSDNSATANLTVNAQVHDLGIALSAPAEVVGGNNATVTATVTNTGNQPMTGYTVTITDGTNTLLTQTVNEALAPGATATFTADCATTEAQVGTTVNFTANVACNGDEDATNNSATASTAVITLPPPEDVVATPDNDTKTATVTWNAPSGYSETTLEWDFEEEADFNDFTTVDADGDGYNWAWHYNINDGSNLETNSGSGVIYSQSYDKPTSTVLYPNNWLISPEVPLGGTLTFYACGQDPNQYWNEVFGVYVCVGSYNGVSDFVQIAPDVTTTHDMTQYTYHLSQYQGQGYFAIVHHNVHDEFYLDVDDINYFYTVGHKPDSYNVYLDGQLVGNVDADDPLTYDFNNLTDGQHTVEISAVYPGNIESAKVPAQFTITPKTSTPTLSMVNNGDGTYTITATATAPDTDAEVTLNVTGYQPVTATGSASITITQTNADQTVTATATAQADDKLVSNEASENYTVPALPITPTPSITYEVNGDNVVITATGQGEVTLNVTGQEPVSGNGSVSITLPRTDVTYTVTATATAQATNHQPSATETQQITVPFLQTDKPSISYVINDDNVVITATGDGIVTLNVPGYAPVSDNGSVSVTVPLGMNSTTLTVTATAKEEGKAESETETAQVPIPAATGWTQMLGEYNNPNDLLSFQIKVGNDTLDIMMVDQFLASTFKNAHPDGYTYVMKETVNNEEKSSNEVRIPVYKTDSKMNGFYTKYQVDSLDLKMGLRAQVINSEMCNDVDPDRNTLYHSLYRSNLNGDYPVIDVPHRVSQLQKYEENVNNNVQYYFTEMHTSGVTPKYDHVGHEIVERLDTNYVQGVQYDSLAYVPVIWTFGLYSGREDGKNNSYGSDIKREHLGGVSATITGEKSDYSAWGMWTADGVEYCVYTPVITITGMPPAVKVDNDGDVSTYVPYMYRAWCLYEGAHDFVRNSNNQLIDNGVLTAPILLDERVSTETGEILGGPWTPGTGRLPWAFGIPVDEEGDDVTFAIRFYYKKTVTEAGQEPNNLRDGEEEEYYIVECEGDAHGITTAINELFNGRVPVETIYYNSLGMQSSEPFDGINIVVTRYNDGTTSTTKVMR